ncbi:exopolysaccharide production repressor protein [Mesorhizobium sp. B1-1-8]|uniref:exopolysaccharide production repressor protein n=1 Tax=Mesorhizobium sp. B1-1-8 TaxID=2589976 RepID=UPI001D03587A|nr:exopolysaccharide production repressor protein [Mesorhizobium sp. B1-1-8]UCI10159.1 exopolysaccharide production repressor protein [Mesorhizobium sp. B1-1-8]
MATGSIWQALGWTIVAAVLLQVAYFVLTTWLVSKRRDLEKTGADKDTARVPPSPIRPTRNRDGRTH